MKLSTRRPILSIAGVAVLAITGGVGAGCSNDGDSTEANVNANVTDPPSGDESSVQGSVIAPEDAPPNDQLPAGSVLTVTLEDVSLADAPAVLLADEQFDLAENKFPVGFVLDFDEDDIVDAHSYRVAARVEANGDLIMISDTVIPVITNGAPTTGIAIPVILIASG